MASYLGRNWKKEELLSLIGDPSQVAGATPFVLADGMEVLRADLKNGLLSIDLARPEPARIVRAISITPHE